MKHHQAMPALAVVVTTVAIFAVAPASGWLAPGLFRNNNNNNNRAVAFATTQTESMMLFGVGDTTDSSPSADDLQSVATTATSTGDDSMLSRRSLLIRAYWSAFAGLSCGSGVLLSEAFAWTVDKVDPDENDIYAEAQTLEGPLRVLWVGAGTLNPIKGAARSGVYKNLFRADTEVTAVDLLKPTFQDLKRAQAYATKQGYKLKFRKMDATKLAFGDESFDVVVCSLFLCQDFDPEVVVNEIKRVLKPGGRFGFYEHIEDIDKVVVGKVFGEKAVIRVEADPYKSNILAGVVRKA